MTGYLTEVAAGSRPKGEVAEWLKAPAC
jgi:hypothetical protein